MDPIENERMAFEVTFRAWRQGLTVGLGVGAFGGALLVVVAQGLARLLW